MTKDGTGRDAETLQAVAELLVAGEQYGIGVTFKPDSVGWTVGCLRGMGGGELSEAYDLRTAALAALRPLVEFGEHLNAQ